MKQSPLLVWVLLAGVVLAALAAVLFINPTTAEVTRRKTAASS